MDWFNSNFDNILQIALEVVGIFSIVATMTPNDSDNKVVEFVLKIINAVGGNFGKAKFA